ncbi:hypothetical protein [Cupriavidus sp. 8B]
MAPHDAERADLDAPGFAQGATKPANTAPVRLHAEWTDEGVRIWLGVDYNQVQSLPEITQRLERLLADSGTRLIGLVCNGRAIRDNKTATAASDWSASVQLAVRDAGYRNSLPTQGESSGLPIFHHYEQAEP